jgi:DNA-binding HxlR family transcriptional regulator
LKPPYDRRRSGGSQSQTGALFHTVSVAVRILEVIGANEDITYRQTARKLPSVHYATLSKYLIDMRELGLVEKTLEVVSEDSQIRGLRKFVSHYRITRLGVQFLESMPNPDELSERV